MNICKSRDVNLAWTSHKKFNHQTLITFQENPSLGSIREASAADVGSVIVRKLQDNTKVAPIWIRGVFCHHIQYTSIVKGTCSLYSHRRLSAVGCCIHLFLMYAGNSYYRDITGCTQIFSRTCRYAGSMKNGSGTRQVRYFSSGKL